MTDTHRRPRVHLGGTLFASLLLALFSNPSCAHTGYRLADRAARWQTLEDSGCRVGTIEGAGEFESRCYICPDGGKVCV